MPMVPLVFLNYLGHTHGSGGKTCSSGSTEPCINSAQDKLGYGDRICDGDARDSSRSDHSLGAGNRFHVDVEGFQIAAHLGQAAYRLDGTV